MEKVVKDLKCLYANWTPFRIRGAEHQDRLESFYSMQADEYDSYRAGLLHGREHMISLCAARLRDMGSDLVWVDLGGGTGKNVEMMFKHISMNHFKKVVVVDLCPSLCRVAMERVQSQGWEDTVEVVEADVTTFKLEGQADIVTFSYSLTMIPNFHAAVDVAYDMIHDNGLLGVADFYTSQRFDSILRQNSYLTRVFWRSVFEMDGVYVGPERRQYLDHKFHELYEFNNAGTIPYVPFLRAPYYVFVGTKNPSERPTIDIKTKSAPLGFTGTFLYSMTWEDPEVDDRVLDINSDDVILSLTSGGCNLLHMLLQGPKKVIAVDLNPAQNYLLELKLISIQRLQYEDFWKMFGEGRHPNINDIFENQLAPFLSPGAANWWSRRLKYFDYNGLYHHGGMGWAITILRWAIWCLRASRDVKDLLQCTDLEDQKRVWHTRVRKTIVNLSTVIDNPLCLWAFHGVPHRQLQMVRESASDGTLSQYAIRRFDQIMDTVLLRENYFYTVCLDGHFTKDHCPEYLKEENFGKLKNLVTRVVVCTDTFQNVVARVAGAQKRETSDWKDKLTKVTLMDHMDWLPEPPVNDLIDSLTEATSPGAKLIWRSASYNPWYSKNFDRCPAWEVTKIHDASEYMDRVNTYCSFYTATRVPIPEDKKSD